MEIESPIAATVRTRKGGRSAVNTNPRRRAWGWFVLAGSGALLAALAWWQASVGEKCFLYGPAGAPQRNFIEDRSLGGSGAIDIYAPLPGADLVPTPPDQIERRMLRADSRRGLSLTESSYRQSAAEPSLLPEIPEVPSYPRASTRGQPDPVAPWDVVHSSFIAPAFQSLSQQFNSYLSRMDCAIRGTSMGTNVFPLQTYINIGWYQQLFRSTNSTFYFASGLDMSASIYPLVTSNEFGIHPFRTSIERVFASNGLTLVRLGSDAFKIYPTAQAAKYANAPVP